MSESGSSHASTPRTAGADQQGSGSDKTGASVASDDPLSPGHHPGLRVELLIETEDTEPPVAGWLNAELARIAALAGVQVGEVTLAVVDDARMSELHKQYCNVPGTTDVLTFDLRDDPHAPIEGDLVLCVDEARRQATQRGHDVRLELLLYAVHGLLHLLGEDDHDPDDAKRMHEREDALLTQAGYPAIYRHGETNDAP